MDTAVSLASKASRENASQPDHETSKFHSGVPYPKIYSALSRPASPGSKQRLIPRPSSTGRGSPERPKSPLLHRIKSSPESNLLRPTNSPSKRTLISVREKVQAQTPPTREYEEPPENERDHHHHEEIVHEPLNQTSATIKLQRSLVTKKREFLTLKKKFAPNQTILLEMFINLKEMEKKCLAIGLNSEDTSLPKVFQMIDCGEWNVFDLALLKDGKNFSDISSAIGGTILNEMHVLLRCLPDNMIALCAQLMTHRQNFIDWLKSKMRFPNYPNFGQEMKVKIMELSDETQNLNETISVAASEARKNVEKALEIAKSAWVDREDLIKKIDALQKDLHLTHQNIKNLTAQNTIEHSKKSIGDEPTPKPETAPKITEEERRTCKVMREKLTNAEGTIRIAKAKIADLEKDVKEANNKAQCMVNKNKELENQLRQRETCFESRARKLHEVSKVGESTVESLTKQRDALENRVKELQQEMYIERAEMAQREQEMRSNLDSVHGRAQADTAAKRAAVERENKMKEELARSEEMWQDIRAHCDMILALQRDNQAKLLPAPQLTPNEREVELYEELEATRKALIKANEEIQRCKHDKDSFLESLDKIATCESNGTVQEKLASELLEKEKRLSKLNVKVVQYEEEIKSNNHMVEEYEEKISELRFAVLRLQNYELSLQKTGTEDLQQQLLELHLKMAKTQRERNHFQKQWIKSSLMLERYDSAIAGQHQMLQLKEHLRSLLRPWNSDMRTQAEMRSHLAAVCSSASKNWSVLELSANRQKQLEDTILAQNDSISEQQRIRVELEHTKAHLMRKLINKKFGSSKD